MIMEFEITRKVSVSDQDIDDILCTALEGGINYWVDSYRIKTNPGNCKYVSDVVSKGGTIEIDVIDDETHELNLEKFQKGIEMFLNEYPNKIDVDCCIDPGDIDACDADCIVQYALFNELVYS